MAILTILAEILFVAGTIIFLYRQQDRLGLAPVFIFIGSNQYFQAILASTVYLPLGDRLSVSPGSAVLFTSSLFAILLIYIREDVPKTRTLIYGIVISNVTLTILSVFTKWQLDSGRALNVAKLPPEIFAVNPRVFLVGTITLILDSLFIVIVYEFLYFKIPRLPLYGRILGALLTILYFDAVVFTAGAFWERPEFPDMVVGNLAGKTLSGVAYASILFAYLALVRKRAHPESEAAREIRDVFAILTYRERYEAIRRENDLLESEISRRVLAEAALREERSQLRAIIDSSRDGIVLVGPSGEVLVANREALRALGCDAGAIAAPELAIDEMIAPLDESVPAAAREIRAATRPSETPEGDGAGGSFRRGAVSIDWKSFSVEAGDRPIGRLLVLRDVSSEEALARLREDITRATIHDLRNPLAAMTTILQTLDDRSEVDPDPERVKLIRIAGRSASRMRALVDALLELSRLESGQIPMSIARTDLAPLVAEVVEVESFLASSRNQRIESRIPDDAVVLADRDLLRRTLENLVGNAVKFGPDGAKIRIELRRSPTESTVSVVDDGSGIPEALRGRLFEKFASGTHRERGTGLGLAFCRLAVQAQGGRIWADDPPDGGTAIRFSLPAPPEGR